MGHAEANGIDPEDTLPKLVAARSLAGTDDVASILHGRLVRHGEQAKTDRRVRPRPQQWILGLVRKPTGHISPAFTQALADREVALRKRAAEVLRRATEEDEAWLADLGPRPTNPDSFQRWVEVALAVAAYRDRHQVGKPSVFGKCTSTAQEGDFTRISALIAAVECSDDLLKKSVANHQPATAHNEIAL